MGALGDIVVDTRKIRAILESYDEDAMKRKKPTREEYRAWWEARETRIRELHEHIARIKAELAAKKSPS